MVITHVLNTKKKFMNDSELLESVTLFNNNKVFTV